MTLRRLAARLRALGGATRFDRELEDEIAAHLELAERDALAAGLSAEDARAAARRQFGGVTQMQEKHRDTRSVRWIENAVKDVRYGFGSLVRDPVFAIVAVAVLGLGIGANTAMFGLVDAVLLKPLPFPNPDRIVRVWEAPTPTSVNSTTTGNFLEWKRRTQSFEALSAETLTSATVAIDGEPTRLEGRLVSADHFEVFGLQAAIGRTFRRDEDQPGAAPVVVLSHAVWTNQFGGDPAILDRVLLLDGEPHRVVGILPPGSFDRDVARPGDGPAAFWKPLVFTPRQIAGGEHWLNVVGRLRRDVTIEQARRDMLSVRAGLVPVMPAWKKEWSIAVEPFDTRLLADHLRQSMYLALGAVVVVLLIACANITNLLLARGATRSKELAVRAALGASRARLIAQLLTESLVLCSLGGLAGIAFARLLVGAALPLLPVTLPFTAEVTLDVRVLGITAVIALTVSVAVGLLPALQIAPGSLTQALNLATRGSTRRSEGVSRAIVVAEVALSLMLICGALLLLQSLRNLQRVDLGVRVERIITASIDLPSAAYPAPQRAEAFFAALTERVQAVPGVERAALTREAPLGGAGGEFVRVAGREGQILVGFKRVDAGYFDALDVPILAGRGIGAEDRSGAPRVVVINKELARQLADRFGVTDPVGTVISLAAPGYEAGSARVDDLVVGVIQDEFISRDLRAGRQPVAYVSLAQVPIRQLKLIVRATNDSAVMPAVREAVRQVDPHLALAQVETMEQIKARSLSGATQPAWLIGAFAAVASLLAALGLYGILAHAVGQRQQEIGIRIALGARPRDVLSDVLRSALATIVLGLVLGTAGAFAVTRVMTSLLFGVSPIDPLAFATASAAMIIVGLLAAWIPANRAASVDAMTAIRAE